MKDQDVYTSWFKHRSRPIKNHSSSVGKWSHSSEVLLRCRERPVSYKADAPLLPRFKTLTDCLDFNYHLSAKIGGVITFRYLGMRAANSRISKLKSLKLIARQLAPGLPHVDIQKII